MLETAMKFLSLTRPFKAGSSSNPPSARKGQAAEHATKSRVVMHEDREEQAITNQHAARDDMHHLPVVSANHASTPPASTARHTRSTPPAIPHHSQQQQQLRQDREYLSPPSRTSFKRALAPSNASSTRQAQVSERHDNQNVTLLQSPPSIANPAPDTHRRRKKSFKELFTLPSSMKSSQAMSASTDPPHIESVNRVDPVHTRRRYSFASSPSSSSNPVSPISPASIRKSTSTSAFKQNRENSESVIPPVPALPAHISLAPISPITSISASTRAPQTPSSSSSSSMRIPCSATSISSSIPSTPDTASSSRISRSPSVPTLHASFACTASPSSSTGTLATPQTIDLRSPPSSTYYNGTKQQHSRQDSDSKHFKTLDSIPLLLGPSLRDTLLSSETLHTAEILEALRTQQQQAPIEKDNDGMEEIKSEDGYGSEVDTIADSTESNEYGTASNISHGGNETGTSDIAKSPEDVAEKIQKVEVRMNEQSKSLTRANSGSLRVDTSLASSSSLINPANKRTSTYLCSNNSPSSLSPYLHSFPTSPLYRTDDLQHSTSSASLSISRRTPTPTLTVVPSPSPRALSQGAKICLDYTILRLRKDGSCSSSIQPEKVNILQYGGRRYPSSTRILSISPLHISTSFSYDENDNRLEHQQQRKESKSADMKEELAWMNIVKKLQSRKRLTLMEEVELDTFKKLQNNWTPCSSPLALTFNPSSSSLTNAVDISIKPSVHAPGAPPLSTPANTALRDHTIARKLSNDQPQVRFTGTAQPMLGKSALRLTSPFSPPPSASTSALISGAFLKAQQTSWLKWLSRRPFEARMKITLQNGESFKVVREMQGQLIVSDRIHAWASATLGELDILGSKSIMSLSNDTSDSVKTATIQNVASPQSAMPLPRDEAPNANPKLPYIVNSNVSNDSVPFARNHIAISQSRFPSSNETAATSRNKPRFNSSSDSSLVAMTTKSNSKAGFGRSLAAKLGFKTGKNKVSSSISREQDRDASEAEPTEKLQESSSSSSFANTMTPNSSTPSTSASSACSDQMDTITISKADNLAKPVRPERSALRPPREERQRLKSMVRSASQGVPSAQGTRRTSMFSESHSGRANDLQPSTNRSDRSLPSRPRSMIPKSQSEQQIHSYHARGVSLEAPKQSSMIIDPASIPPVPQRRVRVLSQPEGLLAPRPHSMYTQPQSRKGQQEPLHNTPGPRPMSQLLQVPRPISLLVPGVPALRAGNSHSDPQVRTMSSPQIRRDVRQRTSSRHTDDDETPLAVLRKNSGTPPSINPSSKEDTGTPEPRPRLRSAMRSTSQPRPISTVSSANRNSTISFQEGPSRSASPVSKRLSMYDPPSPRKGRESWVKSENTLKSLIIEEQLKQDNEAKEITRRREQRKVWEDHRRRSVYLEDQAAAAEKAATEAQRRQSHLYMSMALAHPQPQPPHDQALLLTNGLQRSPYGGIQQPRYFPPQHLQSSRTPLTQRPMSYHFDQIGNGTSPPIVYGQAISSFQR